MINKIQMSSVFVFRVLAIFLAMFNFWFGQDLVGIGWVVLVQLDSINRKLPDSREGSRPEIEAAREEYLSDEDLAERAEQRRRERELEREMLAKVTQRGSIV